MKVWALLILIAFGLKVYAQEKAEAFIKNIYDEALVNKVAYENLRYLCKQIGPRLSGSRQANQAVEWGKNYLNSLGLDTVWKQEIKVTNWKRGPRGDAFFETDKEGTEQEKIKGIALGGSIGTNGKWLKAPLFEVKDIAELESIPYDKIKGHIVFINKPMDPRHIRTFKAYGACFAQRHRGAVEAAKKGAVGVWLRSLSLWDDHEPHTGNMKYDEGVNKIPAMAIGTSTADSLHKLLRKGSVNASMMLNCYQEPDTISHNVIGELRGSLFPDEYIVIGGHLDSWDTGEGAHDDGAGIVQSMEVLRLFKTLSHKPKRSIRVVLFMNEENGVAGGTAYAKRAKALGEKHIAGLESDRGGFTPRGFTFEHKGQTSFDFNPWVQIMKKYHIDFIKPGYSGVDIHPLVDQGPVLFGYEPDSQRYFDYHHSDKDVFESVHPRELMLGAAAMTSLVYLIDQNGIPFNKIKDLKLDK